MLQKDNYTMTSFYFNYQNLSGVVFFYKLELLFIKLQRDWQI